MATVEGRARLWLRSLDSIAARPLAGTDYAAYPFWAPDSRSVGFFADGKLKRIEIGGDFVQSLANAPLGRGGAWNRDGLILFAPTATGPIFRIAATGGEPAVVTQLTVPHLWSYRFPHFLPNGRHFLCYATGTPEARGVHVGHVDRAETRRLLDADVAAVYDSSGHLLFVRRGTLFAQIFDPGRLEPVGTPFPVAEQVIVDATMSVAALSASAAGPIVFRTGIAGGQRQFVWSDRVGKELRRVGEPHGGVNPSMPPDGRRVALSRTVNGKQDIWFLDLTRGVLSRFTFDVANSITPVWTPDGARVVFASNRTGETCRSWRSIQASGWPTRVRASKKFTPVAHMAVLGRGSVEPDPHMSL